MRIAESTKKYNRSEHLVYACQYHVIFCPKYRRGVLTDAIEIRLQEIFNQVKDKYQFEILEMEIRPDHVHLIIDFNPRFGIMECVRKLKGASARTLRKEFPALKSRLPSLWTRSAFISSVGAITLGVVKRYLENQKNKWAEAKPHHSS